MTRFPRATTLGRAHYAIGHIKCPTSHIKCAIAHRHRDPHAWGAIANSKSLLHIAALYQRARLPISTTMGYFKTPFNSQITHSVDGSGHHYTARSTHPEICIFSPSQVAAGIQNTIEHCEHLSLLFSSTQKVVSMLSTVQHVFASWKNSSSRHKMKIQHCNCSN